MSYSFRDPRIDEQGLITITCPHPCGNVFRTNNTQAKYCSLECKRRAANQRHYFKHRSKLKTKARLYKQKKARSKKRGKR